MSAMLASVSSLQEALLVQDCDVDIIDLKDPARGALGALDLSLVTDIVEHINGATTVSATIGDLPYQAELIEKAVRSTAATGVDIIKIGAFGDAEDAAMLALLARLQAQGLRIVLVIFAENYNEQLDMHKLARAGISGLMLDTMDKGSGSLRDKLADPVLHGFIDRARELGLLSGLAGSLQEQDIAPLLPLAPDYLGFRGALCCQGRRNNLLDLEATRRIRARIPCIHSAERETHAIL